MTSSLYAILTLDQWNSIKANGKAALRKSFDEFYTVEAGSYFEAEIRSRTGHESPSNFCYCFYQVPKCLIEKGRHVVVRIRVPQDQVVPFDDVGFLHVINNMHMERYRPLTMPGEPETNDDASKEQCFDSYQKMFLHKNNDGAPVWDYSCKPALRAFIPEITRDMITKARHFSFGKRLQK